ncbi:MAG: hypothetical protein ACD_11C00054G0009 [uncultured bacterium]|nr:MAG: hypothetical protein ACD_11C00054G0009 [uncultured bacterium]HBR71985.1 hypothetical protein [Candidatus Moranbacteria bacterium]
MNENRSNQEAGAENKNSASIWKNLAFVPAIIAAVFKDVLDIVIFIIEVLGATTVVLAPLAGLGVALMSVVTFCISIFIGFMLMLAGMGGRDAKIKNFFKTFVRNFLFLIFGTAIELVPGLGILPVETITVIAIFFMTMAEKKLLEKVSLPKV